jgi:hypothetical protein
MIYRIDFQHFLSHAIDHFTTEELSHFQYAIISAAILNAGRASNVVKMNMLYPLPEIVEAYAEYQDKSIMEKMYMDYLAPKNDDDGIGKHQMENIFYNTFINPLVNHVDVVIVCDRNENDYIDVICKVLKKEYLIEVIDLNKLFIEGKVGPIYIDRDKIWDKAVDIRLASADDQRRALQSSSGGRLKLLNMMNKKEKIQLIEELGIIVNSHNKEDLDAILMDAWVNDEDD